jgi:hypothetical protein
VKKQTLVIISIVLILIIVLINTDFGRQGKVYDCSLAEWHPDIPVEVKDECRRLRREIQKEQDKIYI